MKFKKARKKQEKKKQLKKKSFTVYINSKLYINSQQKN